MEFDLISRTAPDMDKSGLVRIPSNTSSGFNWRTLLAYMGPGFLVSIAYIDPGNLDTDIQAGANFQFSLIWVLVLATILGLILQTLSARLGIVTGCNLAQMCRKEYTGNLRYALWAVAEVTVIASDIPEVIGTAIALNILFGFQLWVGVIITSVSVILFLMISYFGVRKLEILIGSMVAIILVCFMVELFISGVSGSAILSGFVPSFPKGALYSATALIGAVVMPHNLFLHSALVQSRDIGETNQKRQEACAYNTIELSIALLISLIINIGVIAIAATDFYPNSEVGLSSAPDLLDTFLGSGRTASILFAVALLASGQSSTMTGTYAGQFVMEGFLDLKIKQWVRAILTRGMAIVPSLIVALIAGDKGADDLIILSQAVLSILLPFALIPLVKFTNCSTKMGVFHNPPWLQVLVAILGVAVTIANVALVGAITAPLFESAGAFLQIVLWLVTIALTSLYAYSLVYLIRRPLLNLELVANSPGHY